MKKILLLPCFGVILFFAVNIAFAEAMPITIIPAGGVKQGQTAFIKVNTADTLNNPVFKFKNKQYKLFKSGENEYSGILGVEATENPGTKALTVADGTKVIGKTTITVLYKTYPRQNIHVTSSMSSLEPTNDEQRQIGKAKSTISDEKFWADFPFNSPTRGCIASIYGLKRFYNGVFSGDYHKGVDIKASKGTPVKSIADGKVLIASPFRLNGTTVAVDHGQGLVSFYLHLSKLDVKPGDIVKSGQKVGEVGATGFATGPHLHWGLYINGTPIDPMAGWIKPAGYCR